MSSCLPYGQQLLHLRSFVCAITVPSSSLCNFFCPQLMPFSLPSRQLDMYSIVRLRSVAGGKNPLSSRRIGRRNWRSRCANIPCVCLGVDTRLRGRGSRNIRGRLLLLRGAWLLRLLLLGMVLLLHRVKLLLRHRLSPDTLGRMLDLILACTRGKIALHLRMRWHRHVRSDA